jgi:hypothetical protein
MMLQSNRDGRAATVVAEIERSRRATGWAIGAFIVILAAAVSGSLLLIKEKRAQQASTKNADSFERHRIAMIVFNEGSADCKLKFFDNKTGGIADANAPCPEEVKTDWAGDATPKGTLHTIRAISKSFKSPWMAEGHN